ncbi:ThiF family adenylyltransferase [Nanoarchaeota archaeon]
MIKKENKVDDRYHRQELIKGWDQKKLEKSRIVIHGSGKLANYTSVCLASLGIGNLEIYDNAKLDSENGFLLYSAYNKNSKAKGLQDKLKEINPNITLKGLHTKLQGYLLPVIGTPDLIIDTTNNPKAKSDLMQYAKSKEITVISASADENKTEIYIVKPGEKQLEAKLEEYVETKQGNIPSMIGGGIITEEARKLLMALPDDDKPFKNLAYSILTQGRFTKQGNYETTQNGLKGKKVLMIGAGALGNFAGLGIALEGISKLDIMDHDEVESTNRNRQILFYDSVGKKKAKALAEKLEDIAPSVKVRGIVAKLDERSAYFSHNKPDLILDCVDSFAARAVINYYAVKHNIPLISGGTNPRSGQVAVYRPGISACLDCKLKVEKALAEKRKAKSCKHAPDPSVIMTNQVIGGMMVGEAVRLLKGEASVKRILKYDSDFPSRGGLIGSGNACKCTKPNVKTWLEEVDKLVVKKKVIRKVKRRRLNRK